MVAAQGERFRSAQHLYAADLDLFGPASLSALLSTARTRMGEDALASWLYRRRRVETLRQRQAAVAELRNRLDLREDLEVFTPRGRGWSRAPREAAAVGRGAGGAAPSPAALGGSAAGMVLAVGATVVWAVRGTFLPLLAVLIVWEASVMRWLKKRLQGIFSSTGKLI